MSAPVNVRQWLGDERFMYGPGTESRAKCEEAHAAVAELIDAVELAVLVNSQGKVLTPSEIKLLEDVLARAIGGKQKLTPAQQAQEANLRG